MFLRFPHFLRRHHVSGIALNSSRSGLHGRTCALWLGFTVLSAGSLHAHRPTESTAEFRWAHARLEARVTFPLEMATRLLEDADVTALNVENFSANRSRFIERATDAFVAEADGHCILPAHVTAELSRDGEVACVFVFPPQAVATLSVRATFLEKLPSDCFCLLRVWEGADRLLGRRMLVRNSPTGVVRALDGAPGISSAPPPPAGNREASSARASQSEAK